MDARKRDQPVAKSQLVVGVASVNGVDVFLTAEAVVLVPDETYHH